MICPSATAPCCRLLRDSGILNVVRERVHPQGIMTDYSRPDGNNVESSLRVFVCVRAEKRGGSP